MPAPDASQRAADEAIHDAAPMPAEPQIAPRAAPKTALHAPESDQIADRPVPNVALPAPDAVSHEPRTHSAELPPDADHAAPLAEPKPSVPLPVPSQRAPAEDRKETGEAPGALHTAAEVLIHSGSPLPAAFHFAALPVAHSDGLAPAAAQIAPGTAMNSASDEPDANQAVEPSGPAHVALPAPLAVQRLAREPLSENGR